MSATAAILISGVIAGAASYLISQSREDHGSETPSASSTPDVARDVETPRSSSSGASQKSKLLVPVGFGAIFGLSLLAGSVFDSLDENRGFARFDEWVAEWGSANATSLSTSLLKIFTELGGTAVVVTATLLTGAYAWKRHANTQILWFLASVTIGQALINLGLKELINRERPDIDQLAYWAGSSFPSGHSAAAAATWAAVAFVLGLGRSTTTRAFLAGAGALIAGLVAATRALLGVHWLTDVLAGVALGWAWFAVCAVAFGGSTMRFGSLFTSTPGGLPVALPRLLRTPLTMGGVTRRLLARYVALVGLFTAAGYVVVNLMDSTVVADVDRRVSDWFVTVRTERGTMLTDWGSAFSDTVTIVIALVLVSGVLAIKFRRWLEPAFVVAAVALETSVFVSAAWLVGRDRPQVEQLDVSPPTASFPSGHTAAAVAFYGALVILVWLHNKSRAARYAAAGLGALIPLIVAISRLYRGMHYVTDVVAGTVLGLLSLYLTLTAFGAARTTSDESITGSPVDDGDAPFEREGVAGSPDSARSNARNTGYAMAADGSRPGTVDVERIAVVANPVSSEEEAASLRKGLSEAGVSPLFWFETTEDDPGTGQGAAAVSEGADLVLAVGGDGTVRAVLESLVDTGVPLGVIPSGTGNLLAGNLSVPHDVDDALAVALSGHNRTMDVGVVNDETFAIMAGIGFDARVMRDTDRAAKQKMGMLAYVVEGMRHLGDRPFGVSIEVDGASWYAGEAAMVLVGNMGSIKGAIEIFPDASVDDGRLNVMVVRADGAISWVRAAVDIALERADSGTTETRNSPTLVGSGREITVVTSAPIPYELDGEERPATTRFEFSNKPGALEVMVPETDYSSDADWAAGNFVAGHLS